MYVYVILCLYLYLFILLCVFLYTNLQFVDVWCITWEVFCGCTYAQWVNGTHTYKTHTHAYKHTHTPAHIGEGNY